MTRSTKAKLTVQRILESTPTPISLNELFSLVKQQVPTVAYSTVYRIINKYLQENKVIRTDWRQRSSKFEWSSGRPHHHHLVCQSCNNITDIDDKLLSYNDQQVSQKTGFIIKHHSIELFGICQPCLKTINL